MGCYQRNLLDVIVNGLQQKNNRSMDQTLSAFLDTATDL